MQKRKRERKKKKECAGSSEGVPAAEATAAHLLTSRCCDRDTGKKKNKKEKEKKECDAAFETQAQAEHLALLAPY